MQIMSFDKFKHIMTQIKKYEKKRDKISDFLEKEVCADSYCLFTVGEDLITTLTSMLADHFNCWYQINYNPAINELREAIGVEPVKEKESEEPKWWDKSFRRWENDIEYYLYEENKKIIIDGKDIPIKTLKQFYKYLIKYCVDRKQN